MKIKPFLATFSLLFLLTGALETPKAFAQQPAQPSTVAVAFQGSGTGTFGTKQMPFGFSIRCYATRCVGALAFGSNLVNYVTGIVIEIASETFMISVSNAQPLAAIPPGSSIACALINTPPVTQGQTNKVTITCARPSGNGTSTNAFVMVSGGNGT